VWLDLDGNGALHQQVYRGLRQAILDGVLRPATRLPATRILARELGVSRNTLLHAYEQLRDEGYVVAQTGSGTTVAEVLPEDGLPTSVGAPGPGADAPEPLPLSARAQRMLARSPRGGLSWNVPRRHLPYDFRYGEPAYGDLPLETWCRLLGRRARGASAQRLAYGTPGGAPELRRALAGYLARARGVACRPEQVLITHGTQQGIDLAIRVLVEEGDRVAIEEPHYTGFSLALAAHGAECVPVGVDGQGLIANELADHGALRGVCLTPSHQFPTGGVLSLERRLALLAWAERERAFVLEDDYDGEYRYEGRPVPSLQSLDRAGRVLYLGTASKLLFPSLRIGWLVVPDALIPACEVAQALTDTGSAHLEQWVLADFIEGGHLERHVRRSRVRNGARREALRAAVERHLGDRAELEGTRAGLHGLLWMNDVPREKEAELRHRCADAGVGIYPTHPFYRDPPARAGFLLGYSALSEADIDTGIERIAVVLTDLTN